MKNVFAAILLFTLSFNGFAQCFPERHNTTWFNQWISCEKTENPNTTRPESHWIMYDFGTELKMYTLNIWNINAPDLLSDGIQKANIDYSSDGVTWFEYGEVTFNQGTGKNTYEGQEVLNFNGAVAKYLLITSESNYGGNCAGFAEMKLEIDSLKVVPTDPGPDSLSTDSICIVADVFPNPMINNELYITLNEQCVHAVNYNLTDASGRILIQNTPIALNETVEILKGKTLSPGVYIVTLLSNYAKSEYKIVKQ